MLLLTHILRVFKEVSKLSSWQMFQFVCDTNADVDMAYDWVCDQLEIDGFVENKKAWDSFYDAWESAANVNEIADLVFS